MTADEFRRTALSFPGATEGSHMGHPDFRVAGKIFATLGYPDAGSGTIMLSPSDQDLLLRGHARAFAAAAGAWGRAGSTSVKLRTAPRQVVTIALESAWKRRATRQLLAAYESGDATPSGTRRPAR
jgi:hypothetical protein